MHGAVLLDENNEVIRPALIWCDQRTEAQAQELERTIGLDRLIQLTCNPPLTNFTVTKLLWVREHEPKNWQRVRKIMLPKDYVRLRLTGESAIDVADASGTLLLDVAHRTWSSEVLNKTGIDVKLLPKLFESHEICGKLSGAGADATGLRAGTPVVAGAGDQAAGAVGMGITRAGVVSATLGTSGVVFAATDRPSLDPHGRLHTFCHAIPDRWHVMGVTQAAGLSLRWFRDRFGAGTDDGRDPYTRAHLIRAVLEGVAYSLKDTFSIFDEIHVPVERIRLGGGGARSPLWQQIQADVYAHEVEILKAEEGAAYGAAILAGVGSGCWKSVDQACDAAVRVAKRVSANKETSAIMQRGYQTYRRIYPALHSIFAENQTSSAK
jgi:xylulokinase